MPTPDTIALQTALLQVELEDARRQMKADARVYKARLQHQSGWKPSAKDTQLVIESNAAILADAKREVEQQINLVSELETKLAVVKGGPLSSESTAILRIIANATDADDVFNAVENKYRARALISLGYIDQEFHKLTRKGEFALKFAEEGEI